MFRTVAFLGKIALTKSVSMKAAPKKQAVRKENNNQRAP